MGLNICNSSLKIISKVESSICNYVMLRESDFFCRLPLKFCKVVHKCLNIRERVEVVEWKALIEK